MKASVIDYLLPLRKNGKRGAQAPFFFHFRRALSLALLVATAGSALFAQPGSLPAEAAHQEAAPGQAAELKSPHILFAQAGAALTASGTIIDSSSGGLRLLEFLVNSGLLYAPRITPALRYTGPIYKIPDLELRSRQGAIGYEYRPGQFGYGGSLRYTSIEGRFQIPETFINGPQLTGYPLMPRVTAEIHGRQVLAAVYQLEGFVSWHFAPDKLFDPFVRASAGGAKGWLGGSLGGPYVHAVYGSAACGLWLNINQVTSLTTEAEITAYWADTGSSSFIDRTDVLVNPGKGSIYIGRASFGAAVRF